MTYGLSVKVRPWEFGSSPTQLGGGMGSKFISAKRPTSMLELPDEADFELDQRSFGGSARTRAWCLRLEGGGTPLNNSISRRVEHNKKCVAPAVRSCITTFLSGAVIEKPRYREEGTSYNPPVKRKN
jgi:hypothetical protein